MQEIIKIETVVEGVAGVGEDGGGYGLEHAREIGGIWTEGEADEHASRQWDVRVPAATPI